MNYDIGFDLDGVIRDIITPVCKVYKEYYDSNSNVQHDDVTTWSLTPVMPLISTPKDHYNLFTKYAKEIFYDAKQYDDMKDVIQLTKEQGYNIHIVTHQFQGIENYTLDWLKELDIPYDSIHFAKQKNLVNLDAIVDDGIHNLKMFNPNKTLQLCMKRNWNTEWNGLYVENQDDLISSIQNYVGLPDEN